MQIHGAGKPHAWFVNQAKRFDAERREAKGTIRLALLSTYTIDPIVPYLKVLANQDDRWLDVYVGPFNQVFQEILDPNSGLYRFDPGAVVIALRLEELMGDKLSETNFEDGDIIDNILDELESMAKKFRENSRTPLVIQNFALPDHSPLGISDRSLAGGISRAIERINSGLIERLLRIPGVTVLDYFSVVAHCGTRTWQDDRLWYMGKVSVNYAHLPILSARYMAVLRQIWGLGRKVLVVDLDNTLWGGVLGEDGIAGVKLGPGYPGNVYLDFQRAILEHVKRGVVLAVCSKNDSDIVEQMFKDHPHMVLRSQHVAAWRVNWNDKATNLREIALELGVGLDSMVFFDDLPAERELVASVLPEVVTLSVPASPLEYRRTLWDCGYFDTLDLSLEDRQRSVLYQQKAQREAFKREAESLDSYLAGLQMVATISEVRESTLGRAVQLIHKTNQFNLTARRYTASQLQDLLRGRHRLYTLSLVDRFGDNGLVGLALVEQDPLAWRLDTFLLSCRVLGRGVESAFLGFLAGKAREVGVEALIGEYNPTDRNGQAATFYASEGFSPIDDEAGTRRWLARVQERPLTEVSAITIEDDCHEPVRF